MSDCDPPGTNIVALPFVAARQTASAPAVSQFGQLIGASEAMRDLYARIAKVAPTTATVFITGESGSGKEVVANAIHERSLRASRPFLALNCGAIPGNLIEAELFGYEKGAFTGAMRTHHGCFERAEGGTLFLDEVTEMARDLQVRLLRVLETGRYTRVGGEHEMRAHVRVIAATNRDPLQAIRDGRLREDLMYRLAVFPIDVPPLRDREGDAELLAERFLQQLNEAEGTRKTLSRHAVATIRSYRWPGNVRELKNVVHRAFIMSDDVVDLELAGAYPTEPEGDCLQVPVGTPLAEIERLAIHSTLELCEGNKRRCAEMLGVSLKTLYNRLAGYQSAAGTAATV
jgi:DNA-binding NtrC family response regulator